MQRNSRPARVTCVMQEKAGLAQRDAVAPAGRTFHSRECATSKPAVKRAGPLDGV